MKRIGFSRRSAGVFLAFHFILWFESLNYTSVASSTVLVTLQPIFAFVGTYFFFKEKLSFKIILSAIGRHLQECDLLAGATLIERHRFLRRYAGAYSLRAY